MLEIANHGAVREIRLARPPVNALSAALLAALDEALAAAIREADSRGGPRALVLSGAPGMFSAGLDVREVMAGEASMQALILSFAAVQKKLVHSPLPIVAALTGHSPAGGAVLALLCDHRIMAAGAFRIGLNEVRVGLYPGELIYRIYARIIGEQRAASWLSRGAMVLPEEALAAGLVDEVVEPAKVLARAIELAGELAVLPPKVYARTRALVRRDLVQLFDSPPESLESLMAAGWVTDETRTQMAKLLAPR
jgi:enoyl-CoA hydratase/carnithine racemase